MDKKTALKTLVEHSYFISNTTKSELLAKMDTMSDDDVETLGRFLALEKKQSLVRGKQVITATNSLIKELDRQ